MDCRTHAMGHVGRPHHHQSAQELWQLCLADVRRALDERF